MKTLTTTPRQLMTTITILALAGLTALPIAINAQVKGAGAAKLTVPTVAAAPVANPAAALATGCNACRSTLISVNSRPTKTGAASETKLIARNDCPDCETTIVTRGTGKLAKDTVVHACAKCSTESAVCCATK